MEEPRTPDEPDWPRTCPECGTELQTAHVWLPTPDNVDTPDVPVARDFCPNPDCPQHDADLAGAGTEDMDPRGGARDRPGSLGGDHGGG